MNQPLVVTFGCRLNEYETQVMRSHLDATKFDDAIVVNTCAVTAQAEKQARQKIRQLRRQHPDRPIIVTGCAAQIHPQSFMEMDEVNHVIGNENKLHQKTFSQLATGQIKEKVHINDWGDIKENAHHLIEGFQGRARAFIQVQNGCDHRCTFCIIPYGRGPSRSVPISTIVNQVRILVAKGYHEVVFTGVDMTSYGADLPGKPSLGQMTRRLLAQVPELRRLRLSSVDPVEVDDDIFDLLKNEPRLMPHLHLSLQSGDNMILKRMKRRHCREDVIDFCRRALDARPDMVFGADIITGFPTETDEMALNTHDLIDECDLTYLHVFPYSIREETPAARMPQVPDLVRKERANILRQKGQEKCQAFFQGRLGKVENVLIEKNSFGHTEHFAPVTLDEDLPSGSLVCAQVYQVKEGMLYAKVENIL